MENKTQFEAKPANPLLLSSLLEFWSVIEPLLLVAKPASLCEIGIGKGQFARRLLDFCAQQGCHYTGIDSSMDEKSLTNVAANQVTLFKQPSLEVLPTLAPQDVFFVDGDHNYYTVSNELRYIVSSLERWPLIFLHDVGWPWARRDQYCVPSAIPAEFRHSASSTLGVMPGKGELAADGFSGSTSDYVYSAANHEGGPRNGVLTAVEDFLKEPSHRDWRLITIPGVFGLGILFAPDKSSTCLTELLAQLEKSGPLLNPLLLSMERNRIDLFLAHLKSVKEWGEFNVEYQKLLTEFNQLDKQFKQLLAQYHALEQSR